MNKCPYDHTKLRPELPPIIPQLEHLRVDSRGYPVPFFVAWINGEPDFRIADTKAYRACVEQGKCWVCGKTLRQPLAFAIGPMCAINRTTAEPPSHVECAEWSVKACPFLTRPSMKRREDELTREGAGSVAGEAIRRNPGVTLIWVTRSYKFFPDNYGRDLIEVGEPEQVSWWAQGREATREEVLESIDSGLPLLFEQCDREETPVHQVEAREELTRRIEKINALLPV